MVLAGHNTALKGMVARKNAHNLQKYCKFLTDNASKSKKMIKKRIIHFLVKIRIGM